MKEFIDSVHGLDELEYDGLSRNYFAAILQQYRPQFQIEDSKRLYLQPATTTFDSIDKYYQSIKQFAAKSSPETWKQLFLVYRDFTTGSTGNKKECVRPSISIHLEMLRLRDVLDRFIEGKSFRFTDTIYYYSRYGTTSFRYVDRLFPNLSILKYVYGNVEEFYEELSCRRTSFILSGTPSSIEDLLELGFGRFSPEFVILAGEECPVDTRLRIENELAQTYNLVVSREFGLLGCECPTSDGFHFFNNTIRCTSDGRGQLRVTDPLNYCTNYRNYSLGDFVSGLEKRMCTCGFDGPYAAKYSGREFRKGYPPL